MLTESKFSHMVLDMQVYIREVILYLTTCWWLQNYQFQQDGANSEQTENYKVKKYLKYNSFEAVKNICIKRD
jgi:hypothetical protein